ncbi:MAG TPA: Gfo/Idh/MocA family oxidoreductase [Amaricoccus sp.]|nr:Gfo/Idh/MocA family oxidoreductase [Amaricoccus sp.]
MLRGGLIGCGFFAMNHLHAWRDVEGAGIVALCDRDPERLARAAEAFGIARTYADAAEMLDGERLDFVDIATTVATHRPLVELAAGAGAHVICQKPFASSMADARAMVAAADAAGRTLMVHENFRWQSAIRRAREEMAAIGRPFWGRVSFRSGFDVYAGQPYLATEERFIIQDLGIHVLDVARFLFGEVATLSARTERVNPRVRGEDVATMLLGHEGGVTSVVDCSYASRLPRENFPETLLEIEGADGSLRLDAGYRLTVHAGGETRVIDASPPVLPWAERPWHNVQESVLAIERHFVACLRDGREPDTSGADNLRTLALVEAAYDSASDGGRAIAMRAF